MSEGIGRARHDGNKLNIPTGPIQSAPWNALDIEDFPAALAEAFAGVELGAYDRRIIEWLAGWDGPTVATIASLVMRARVGVLRKVAEEAACEVQFSGKESEAGSAFAYLADKLSRRSDDLSGGRS
ncbi:hypothetical protein ACIQNG_06735 [Streptomyces sp. NPDC091377]|uniref:hypothetical protein n=1 Tax=Streptomyces sp. NPDC091377 TaxID=3365995 RepID=UPI00382BC84A